MLEELTPDRLNALVALIAGVLILIFPRILNYVVALYLIIVGLLGLFPNSARVNGFPGLRVGHAADAALKSGVTVFLPDEPAIAAVHVAGGAPASRETDLLRPGNLVERVDAVVFSGGSAFGLSAADGVMAWLAAQGRGFAVGETRVPIVPAASLFDLLNGGDKSAVAPLAAPSVYRALGIAACEDAGPCRELGSVGAGTGATTADLKGGFGAAVTVLADGSSLAACVAVNSVGRVTLGTTPHFRAAPFEREKRVRRSRTPLPAASGCRRGDREAEGGGAREHNACAGCHRLRANPRRSEAPRYRCA